MNPAATESELFRDLTDAQRQAVTHTEGPLLVIAAAGSGKTRVITRRVAYLISQGIPPEALLAITFTNKAAGEMKHRISAGSPRPIRDWGRLDQPWPTICTFHSLCLRILKHYAPQIGLPPNFSVFDSADQSKLMKEAIKLLELSTDNFSPAKVHGAISKAKNKLIDAQAYAQSADDFQSRVIARIYTKYQQLLTSNNALDFDDLLLRAVQALRDHPAILHQLQERFRYILIDEYQDTNHAQYVLAHAIALKHRNICVVGDPDQSIYAWRGGDISNILNFEKDYPDAAIVRLEQNYRSTKTILAIAEKLISHNTQRKEKRLWTENADGEKATVLFCADEHDEARAVASELAALSIKGIPWGKMAIFYRMNALSRVVEESLRRASIPYQIARGVEFYNRKEIKDVLAYLRTVANPADEVSFTRIANVPTRGISDNSIKLLQAHAVGAGVSPWQMMQQCDQIQALSARAKNSICQLVQLINSLRISAAKKNAGQMFTDNKGRVQSIMEEVIQRSGLDALLRKEDPQGENELANVNELISAAAEYDLENPEGSLDDYLSRVSLVSDADHLKGAGGAVTLMTLHAAKGLEFPVVAMVGLEEGCLPHSRAQENMDEMEEERRLCYVGITRAQERLIMSKAAYRTIRGLRERTAASQFLSQMPLELLDINDRAGNQTTWQHPSDTRRANTWEEPDMANIKFKLGQRVRHPAFGVGKIVEVSNTGANTRAIVEFQSAGRKTLILEHARLSPA
ncbi:MAG: UvrD-helicase domain-containing protein [Planctomycetota bacterium]|nr:UvrD-helicase domain-containing protein [Planctomycetota bacterium]